MIGRPRTWLAVAAVLLFYFLALDSMIADSPTMDEQNHIARGLAFLRTGDPRLSVEHPPLVNSLSALPLLTMPELELPLDDASWNRQPPDVFWYVFADQFMWERNRDVDLQQMVFLARLPIVYLTLGLALVGWRFAAHFWGGQAPLFVFLLLLFDPNILAHGRYATTDLGGTLFAFLATYALWQMWRAAGWSWPRWTAAALVMGLAFGSKLSTLVFVPIWLIMALLPLTSGAGIGRRPALRRLAQVLSAGLAAVLALWAIFALEWGPFSFIGPELQTLNHFSGPLPTFWAGIERVLLLNSGGRASFLLGEFSQNGFWFYFPVAFLVKTPLPVLLFIMAAVVILLAVRETRRRALFLLLPALLYFAASLQSGLNLGYRHLLPILPFLYLLIGGLAGDGLLARARARAGRRGARSLLPYAPVLSLGLLIIALLLIDGRIHPHYVSSFNALAGGPEQGYNVLLDSNIDWGQDLLRLKQWMAAHDVDSVKLAWFGTADPRYYGLTYEPLPGFPRPEFYGQWTSPPFNPAQPEPGIYAISASNLWELQLAEKNVYPWFRARQPDDRVGYSILIYDVP